MIPVAVQQAWNDLSESRRIALTKKCAKRAPLIFQRWSDAAGLKSFRHETRVNRKANSGRLFDKALFTAEKDQLGMDVLVSFFTEIETEINDRFMVLMDQVDDEDRQTQRQVYAQLLNEFNASPWIRLYLVTALWAEEFDEGDYEKIEQLAAESGEKA